MQTIEANSIIAIVGKYVLKSLSYMTLKIHSVTHLIGDIYHIVSTIFPRLAAGKKVPPKNTNTNIGICITEFATSSLLKILQNNVPKEQPNRDSILINNIIYRRFFPPKLM